MDESHACCGPSRPDNAERSNPRRARSAATPGDTTNMVLLPGGPFLMGNEDVDAFPGDGEEPVREVTLSPFWIDRYAVSNTRFARFVEETGYVTGAESEGWSFVFGGLLPDGFAPTRGVAEAPWWRQVFGADWRHPEGPHSHIHDRGSHPVVHVSWHDALAYCDWAGHRLPTEAEWECAARGGLVRAAFPWGNELTPEDRHQMNVWQGQFPVHNTAADGFIGTAPVDAFSPNGFGLFNTCGNVWEWCSDRWSTTFHHAGPRADPLGPPEGTTRVQRGGSYLCHESYCNRYRVSARTSNTPDSSTGHAGFRCARGA